ncbi:MAG: tetratricopeptide repeat protein [Balneola sp.]
MNISKFIEELKRRNVFKVATAYAIAGWLIIQVIATVSPQLEFPEWVAPFFTVFVLIGFPLALIFAWAFELTPDGIKKSQEVDITESVTSRTGKKLNGIIITVLSMAVIFLLIERVFFAEAAFIENQSETGFETASIAVLPFVDMSAGQDQEYFSDGLSEELLNALAKVEDMKVAGRTSSFKFKGQNENLKLIGDELNVDHILEGSVRKSGNRIRITAQLIKVNDGFHMWSETFDRELTASNIFEIQEEISKKVLGELKVRLLTSEEAELDQIPTRDIEAYQAYLKGNQLLVNRNYDEIVAAIDLYETAIRIDPSFAAAHANLAIAYNQQGYYGNIPLNDMQKNIKESADKAMAINKESAEAHAALGAYYENESNFEEALKFYLKSNELNPNLIDNYNWIGNLYLQFGEPEKQMAWYEKGFEKDPLNPLTIYNRTRVSLWNRDYEEMEMFFEKNIRINPDFIPTYYLKGNIASGAPFGRFDEAFINHYKTIQLDPNFPRAYSFLIYETTALNLKPLATQYFNTLRTKYNQSFEYRGIVGFYEHYTVEKYDRFEEDVLRYLDSTNTPPNDGTIFGDMYDFAMQTGDIKRVLPYFELSDPGLFSDTLKTLTRRNADQAYLLVELLKRAGETEQSDILVTAFCDYAERSKQWLPESQDDVAYLLNQSSCSFAKGDYEKYYIQLEQLYSMHRDFPGVYIMLWDIKNNFPDKYTDNFKNLQRKLDEELNQQRENVIEFLKSEGEWKEEWEAEKN